MGVDRQSIAMGVSPTPIAARERHIKHQMAIREDDYTDNKNLHMTNVPVESTLRNIKFLLFKNIKINNYPNICRLLDGYSP